MGMTIEKCLLYETCSSKTAPCAVCKPDEGCPIYRYFKELIIQNYNIRLKADMVGILEELNLEIDEMFARRIDYTVDKIQDLIQEKIDALKGDGISDYERE